MQPPEVRYVRREGISVAYQMFGSGTLDLLCIPGWVSHLESQWRYPPTAHFYSRLGEFARVIEVDRRGTGLSDRLPPEDLPPLEVVIEDLVAVLDDAGCERAAVFGFKDGCLSAVLFAAMHPDRTSALGLFGPSACGTRTPDYPWQFTTEEWEAWLADVRNGWGTDEFFRELLAEYDPSLLLDEELARETMTFFRAAANTGAAEALERLSSETDIRSVLPLIHVPTLVMHRSGDQNDPVEGGRFVADQIDGARFVELPGSDAVPFAGDVEAVLGEIEEFLTGVRHTPDLDRVLATVLFTDMVGLTKKAAELGDRAWKGLVERHHAAVRAMIGRYRGVEVDTAGDGFFATFDGPARGVKCAQEIIEAVRPMGIEVRAGVHTGEVERIDGKAGGLGVVIGARIGALASPSEVLTSQTVKDLVAGSGLTFEEAGEHELKGVPDRWHLYRVVN
jgi:pimeloyl-ACP methyl ester carboxylesterase